MLILLPPSEGKRSPRRRGPATAMEKLSFPELTETRKLIMAALIEVSARADALDLLGVPAGLRTEVERNIELESLPAAPAWQVFDGVLFEAMDFESLSESGRRRASRDVLVQSALWGPIGLRDRIAPYRLSMTARLPGLVPLAALWRTALGDVLPRAAGRGMVVDCRSSTYASAWQPGGELARRTVAIRVFTETDGHRTVVSHQAKHTRGLVARWLLESPTVPRSIEGIAEVVGQHARVELVDLGRRGFALDVLGAVT